MNKTEVLFGTSNKHKLREATSIFKGTDIEITHYPVDLLELQETSLERIAIFSLKNLPQIGKQIFVEDTGLFIEDLAGFPGPYASHAFKTLGNQGILKLMNETENRNAYFESCVAFRDINNNIYSFIGRCEGYISNKVRGEFWGFDPIFIPKDSLNQEKETFSELGDDIKNKLSHRAKALEMLKEFIVSKLPSQ